LSLEFITGIEGGSREIKSTISFVHMRDDSALNQDGSSRGGKK
jgi:hypothetical protein